MVISQLEITMVDITMIALWLGHESPATTHQYAEADHAMKEKALARLQDPNVVPRRFQADDDLLKFLKTLELRAVRRRDRSPLARAAMPRCRTNCA